MSSSYCCRDVFTEVRNPPNDPHPLSLTTDGIMDPRSVSDCVHARSVTAFPVDPEGQIVVKANVLFFYFLGGILVNISAEASSPLYGAGHIPDASRIVFSQPPELSPHPLLCNDACSLPQCLLCFQFPIPLQIADFQMRFPDEFHMRFPNEFLRCQVLCISISVVISHSVRDFVA